MLARAAMDDHGAAGKLRRHQKFEAGAPPEISTTLQSTAGTFGSRISLPVFDVRPIGRTREYRRFFIL
jgi:hypothetical protein